jgi:hypothetical protein
VLAHDGFLPVVDGIRHPGAHQLVLTATDIARDERGAWTAIGDRTQVPSGSAYAMANRRITARVMAGLHRRSPLVRLRSWFEDITRALGDQRAPTCPAWWSEPPKSETAFEMAFARHSNRRGSATRETDLDPRGEPNRKGRCAPRCVTIRPFDPPGVAAQAGLVESSRLGQNGWAAPFRESGIAGLPPRLAQELGEDCCPTRNPGEGFRPPDVLTIL